MHINNKNSYSIILIMFIYTMLCTIVSYVCHKKFHRTISYTELILFTYVNYNVFIVNPTKYYK